MDPKRVFVLMRIDSCRSINPVMASFQKETLEAEEKTLRRDQEAERERERRGRVERMLREGRSSDEVQEFLNRRELPLDSFYISEVDLV
jgi:hypothetical protein